MTSYLHITESPGLNKEELLSILQKQPALTPEAVAEAIVENNKRLASLFNTALDSVARR